MSHFAQPQQNAPGHDVPNQAPQAPAPGQPSQQAPADPNAGGGGSPFGGPMIFLLPLVLILTMVLTSRSQQKKQKELESNLKVGDRVVTTSGMVGKLTDVGERLVKLEIAPGVNIQMLKTSVQGVDAGDPKPEAKGDAKADAKDKDKEKEKAEEKRA